MRERLVEAVARTLHPDGLVSPGSRLDATAVLIALARALRDDGDAVEAMQDPFRIGDARGKLAKLCDYLEKPDA